MHSSEVRALGKRSSPVSHVRHFAAVKAMLAGATGVSWRIDDWNSETGCGTVVSEHFGPFPFDVSANTQSVPDFRPREAVLVQLDGKAPNFSIVGVVPTHQRQPAGTRVAELERILSAFVDVRVDESPSGTVQFWVGACCDHCTPDALRLRFEDVEFENVTDDEDLDLEAPLIRLATPAEVSGNALEVSNGATAYCLVTSHGNGPDGPSRFIVARKYRLVPADEETPSS